MSERKRVTGPLLACVVALTTAMPAAGQDAGDPSAIRSRSAEYSPYLNYDYPDRVFFGDSHVHTSYSTDAGMFGNTLGPDEAYRFAKGETVTSSTGVRARLLRPLDWLVVADRAENIGLAPMIAAQPRLVETIQHLGGVYKTTDAFPLAILAAGVALLTIAAARMLRKP